MKKAGLVTVLLLGALLGSALPSRAQFARYDYMWARSTGGSPIVMDGVLDEPAWAKADSIIIRYGVDNGIPGSGWQDEGGFPATDKTFAVVKFLVVGNQLWMGATVRDSSIGGSDQFNRFDGLLMSIKQHDNAARPSPPGEHFISWWWPVESGDTHPKAINKPPAMVGRWRTPPAGAPADPSQLQAWDARVKVHGTVNSDTTADSSYVIEMRFDLGMNGYDVTRPQGDIVEWNASVYDVDWYWPLAIFFRFSANRSWIQGPWGNDFYYHNLHIYAKPSVTINSGTPPVVAPDLVIPNAAGWPSPVVDGYLTDAVWQGAPHFDIRYGDDALRNSYGGVGPYRSGQYQPPVNGGQAFLSDPGDATVKYFFKDDSLYLGFDVRDQVVQYHTLFDRWDGAIITINDRVLRGADHNLKGHRITFQVGPTGLLLAHDELPFLRDTAQAIRCQLRLKPGTTLDTLGQDVDQGYTAEFAIDLTKLGYAHGLGDHTVYLGIDLLDGDSYQPITDSYGTRTWFFREYEGTDGPCVAFLDPNSHVTGVGDGGPGLPSTFALLGNFPNPFRNSTTLRFRLPSAAIVQVDVFDLQGRVMASRALGLQPAGESHIRIPQFASRAGVYLYRMSFTDPSTGATKTTLSGKMMLLQ